MNDYHDWYLNVRVLLMACVFETCRKEPIKKKKKKKYAKLRNNAVFGKLIKNPVNKIDVKIMTTRKQYFK